LENDFPKRGEVNKNSQLYELGDLEPSVHIIGSNEESNTTSQILDPSGSNTHESIHQKKLVRRSSRKRIPHRHFEIEGKNFMVAPHDLDEPNNFEQE